MKLRRVLVLTPIALVLVAGVAWAQTRFTDVPADHEHAAAIEHAAEKGWFSGYEDGTFKPDRTITAEQATRVFGNAFPDGVTRGKFANILYIADAAHVIVDDHANTIAEATSVTVGEAISGSVDHPFDVDMFAFDAVEGQLYQIDVALGTLADSWVAVYDADKTQLAYNDDHSGSLASRIFWEAPSSGRYYVMVAAASWEGTGSYTLTVAASDIDDHANTFAEATSVTFGEAISGSVDHPFDVDMFAFDAVEGQLYQIDVALGTLEGSWVAVYDADDRQLAYSDDYEGSSASRIFWEAPSSGRYYVVVNAWEGTGSYTLTVAASDIDDHANTFGGATVTVGEAISGSVDHPFDVDMFAFDAVEGQLYQIDVALGTLEDSEVTLFDAGDRQLAYNDDYESLASRIFWEAPSSGRYYVMVAAAWEGTGSYTLTVAASDIDDHANTFAGATSVTFGEAISGSVDHPSDVYGNYPSDVDWFVFEAVKGRLYEIDVALGTLEDSVMTLYDADDRQLAYNDHSGSLASRIFWEAPSSGRYYVAVESWESTGSYTLTVIVR